MHLSSGSWTLGSIHNSVWYTGERTNIVGRTICCKEKKVISHYLNFNTFEVSLLYILIIFIHLFHYLNFIDMDYIKTGITSRYLLCIFPYVTSFTAQFAYRFMQVFTLDFLGFSANFGVLVPSHWPTYLLMLIGWPYL